MASVLQLLESRKVAGRCHWRFSIGISGDFEIGIGGRVSSEYAHTKSGVQSDTPERSSQAIQVRPASQSIIPSHYHQNRNQTL